MRRALPALALAVALGVAGCGGGGSSTLSNQEYANKLAQYTKPMFKALNEAASVSRSNPSRAQLGSALSSADSELQKASQQIGALKAPSDAAATNADIVNAINTYEKSVAQTEQVVRSGTPKQVKAQLRVLQSASADFVSSLKQAQSQLKSVGIKFSGK